MTLEPAEMIPALAEMTLERCIGQANQQFSPTFTQNLPILHIIFTDKPG
jgi:hypothetical protein